MYGTGPSVLSLPCTDRVQRGKPSAPLFAHFAFWPVYFPLWEWGSDNLLIEAGDSLFFSLVREAVESWESRGGWGKGMMDRQYEGGLDGAVGLDWTVPVWLVCTVRKYGCMIGSRLQYVNRLVLSYVLYCAVL